MWQKKIKKIIYLLNVDNYSPEITDITYPFIQHYAEKIGAEIFIIGDRKFKDYPPVYEKLQIYQLAQEHEADWNIYIDSDTLIHPDMPDITNLLTKDTIMHNAVDFAPVRWKYDRFFMRDGRFIGSCNWFTVASDQCIELWKPLDDLTKEEAIANIFPIQDELKTVVKPSHLIDDYTLSRNIAKYGLKVTTFLELMAKHGIQGSNFLWHEYQLTTAEKVKNMMKVQNHWAKSPKERQLETDKEQEDNLSQAVKSVQDALKLG